MTQISIIIPIYNRLVVTKRGLANLKAAIEYYKVNGKNNYNFRIVVVDDYSSDGSYEWISDNYKEITLLRGNGDLWWTGAINLGVKYSINFLSAEYIILWNDDTKCFLDYFVELENTLIRMSYKNFIFVSKILYQDVPNIIFNYGCLYDPLSGKKTLQGYNDIDSEKYNTVSFVDWSGGMGTIIPVNIIESVEYFDEKRFPQYHGDIDFFLRAKAKGYKTVAIPSLRIWNDTNTTGFNKNSNFKDFVNLLVSNRSNMNIKQNFLFYRRHSNNTLSWCNFLMIYLKLFIKSSLAIL